MRRHIVTTLYSPTRGHTRCPWGSAMHVLLALCHSSRQVIVANKQLDGTDMMGGFLENDNAAQTSRDTRWRGVSARRQRFAARGHSLRALSTQAKSIFECGNP